MLVATELHLLALGHVMACTCNCEPTSRVCPVCAQGDAKQLAAVVTWLAGVCLMQDPAELWNVDNGQLSQLFDDMVKLSLDNCLVDNRWGAVACPDAKRDPKLAVRPPVSTSLPLKPTRILVGACSKTAL